MEIILGWEGTDYNPQPDGNTTQRLRAAYRGKINSIYWWAI